jgi:hypothetical protein
MARERYKPEEIVATLRQVDVLVSQGHRCYRRFDAAVRMALCAFRTGRFLGDGSTLCCRIPRHLAAASGACSFR